VHTPSLGIFFTVTDSAGNAMVGEDRIRYAIDMANGDATDLEHELSLALGTAWDDELEPFRHSVDQKTSLKRQARVGVRPI
jgi:hypothetical protein